MTLEEFLEKLKSLNQKWYIVVSDKTNGRMIRCPNPAIDIDHCPISSIAGDLYHSRNALSAAINLGIKGYLASEIMGAADGDRYHKPDLRKKLLEACGLEEPC